MSEIRAVTSIASLYVFRMLGLFMALPILMLYGSEYEGASVALLGIAMGIYGLTQGVLQIPLGALSDKFGRKPIIACGLIMFALGSFVAAEAESISWLIVGRVLQGCGAIASALMALLTDLTSEKNRTWAMAVVGASIGLSFTLAMVLGPVVAAFGGIDGVFFLAGVLALFGLGILVLLVPNPSLRSPSTRSHSSLSQLVGIAISDRELMRCNWGVFTLHAILMGVFVGTPALFERVLELDRQAHWQLYLPLLSCAFFVMFPMMIYAEKNRRVKPFFVGSVVCIVLSLVGLAKYADSAINLLLLMFVFFVAFNLLEANLPSLVSKQALDKGKGTAMGVFASSQFLGAFVGGALGGIIYQYFGHQTLFISAAAFGAFWCMITFAMRAPRPFIVLKFTVPPAFDQLADVFEMQGVEQVLYRPGERALQLRVDRDVFVQDHFERLIKKPVRLDAVVRSTPRQAEKTSLENMA